MIDVAYLRVYRPADQVRLPVTPNGRDVPRLMGPSLTTESQRADARAAEWGGRTRRCPRSPRRRMLDTLVACQQATNRFGLIIIVVSEAAAAIDELTRIP